jgi:hypothetical protein
MSVISYYSLFYVDRMCKLQVHRTLKRLKAGRGRISPGVVRATALLLLLLLSSWGNKRSHCSEGPHAVRACPGKGRLEGSEEDTVIGTALLETCSKPRS